MNNNLTFAEITSIEAECPFCKNTINLVTSDFFLDFQPYNCPFCEERIIIEAPEQMKNKE